MLNIGDKVVVFHRRRFDEDHLRFFIGSVNEFDAGLASVVGHAWIQEVHRGACHRKPDMRTQLVPLGSGDIIIYRLAKLVELDDLSVEYGTGGMSVLTDGGDFRMDITDRMKPM